MPWPPDLSSPGAVISLLLLLLFSSWGAIFRAILSGKLVPGEDRDTWRLMALTLKSAVDDWQEVTGVVKDVLRAFPPLADQRADERPEDRDGPG